MLNGYFKLKDSCFFKLILSLSFEIYGNSNPWRKENLEREKSNFEKRNPE